jgi:5,10-methylenetetrahydromethanopterin reductase
MRRIGIAFTGVPHPVRKLAEFAELAEKNEMESFWIAEDYFLRDAISTLACLAFVTSRIKVAVGAINPFTRHPVLIAETIATIDELSHGRTVLAIGAGVKPLVEQMCIEYRKPLTAVRESVEVIRRLLKGETLTYRGSSICLKDVKLGVNPYLGMLGSFTPTGDRVPIYVAAEGPKMLELAGEIADGVLLPVGYSVNDVRMAIEHVKIGAERSGRKREDIDVACYILTSISEDPSFEHGAARTFVANLLGAVDEDYQLRNAIDPNDAKTIRTKVEHGVDGDFLRKDVSERALVTFTASGTRDRCLGLLEKYQSAGVRLPIVFPVNADFRATIDLARTYAIRH